MAGMDLVQAYICTPQALLLRLLIALLFFGGQKLPEMARGLGQGLRECKRASEGGTDDEATSSVPQPRPLRPGPTTGTGDQGAPAERPHDERGPERGPERG